MRVAGRRPIRFGRAAARVAVPALVLLGCVLGACAVAGGVLIGLAPYGSPASAQQLGRQAGEPGDTGAKALFTIRDRRIAESSGLATGTVHKRILYTINDSDNEASVYALNRHGRVVATLQMRLVYNRDWEAVAAGPNGRIWVGDIGDNDENQTSITVYRFREPAALHDQRLYWSRFRLQYEDGPHNAETLLVQPKTGQIYVVTKESDGAGIYEAPDQLSMDATNTLHRVGDAPSGVTGGAFLPDGSGVVLRTYTRAYVLAWPSGKVRRTIPLPLQPQGESLAVSRDGKRILVGSEGRGSQVFSVPLTAPKTPKPTPTPAQTPTQTISPGPPQSATPGILVPGKSDPHALVAGLPWWVPTAVLAIAVVAGIAAFPRRRRPSGSG